MREMLIFSHVFFLRHTRVRYSTTGMSASFLGKLLYYCWLKFFFNSFSLVFVKYHMYFIYLCEMKRTFVHILCFFTCYEMMNNESTLYWQVNFWKWPASKRKSIWTTFLRDVRNAKANCTTVFSPSFLPAPAVVWPHHPAPSAPHPDGTAALYRTSSSPLPQMTHIHPGTVLQHKLVHICTLYICMKAPQHSLFENCTKV